MKPENGDDEPWMNRHDDNAPTPAVRPLTGRDGAHDRVGVALSPDEQRRFDQITAPMRTLRVTRGRRSSIVGGARTCLISGIVGIIFSVAVLGVLPLGVSFAGFVLALVAFTELSQNAAGSRWWRRARRLLGFEAKLTTDHG